MPDLFLIRHGAPEAAWGVADDPGLSVIGRSQAEAAARALPPGLDIWSSPMRRCRETATPYEAQSGLSVRVEPRVSEVVAPPAVTDRRAWLAETFPWRDGAGLRDWATLDPAMHAWRADVLEALRSCARDTAIFTHFIAINAVVGAATSQTATIVCRPDHASITQLRVEGGVLELIALGATMVDGDVR